MTRTVFTKPRFTTPTWTCSHCGYGHDSALSLGQCPTPLPRTRLRAQVTADLNSLSTHLKRMEGTLELIEQSCTADPDTRTEARRALQLAQDLYASLRIIETELESTGSRYA